MKEKKEKKKLGLILFIIFMMIGTSVSFVFFGFGPQSEVTKYNGIKFTGLQGRWEAKINGKIAAFSFLPDEVKGIKAGGSAGRLQDKLEIDVTYDLNSTYRESIALAQHQMALTLAQYNIFVRKGFTTNNTFNLPIITCEDSTISVPVVYFREGNSTGIYVSGDCIIAEAPSDAGFIEVKDRLLYSILGVME